MNITNETVIGMMPQDKEIFFKHMEKRHKEEAEKVETEKIRMKMYKESLIKDILKFGSNYSIEQLNKMPIRTLERIAWS